MAPDDRDSKLRPCMLLQPSDDFWPAVVHGGIELHAHGPGETCNPAKCCVVASTDGLIAPRGDD